MPGIVGMKVGMISAYDQEGRSVAATVIQAGPCVVTQLKSIENDGYRAVQLAYGEKKESHTTDPLKGHFKKAGATPRRHLVEFRDFRREYESKLGLGSEIRVGDVFKEGDWLDAVGVSKGRGFQGVVRRHGFSGVGSRTHGQHNRMRAPGSVGNSSFASRVPKGRRMAGQMGGDRVKLLNLRVLKVIPEHDLILVKGPVPGAKKGIIILEK